MLYSHFLVFQPSAFLCASAAFPYIIQAGTDSSETLYFSSEESYNKGRDQIENLIDFETGLIWTE